MTRAEAAEVRPAAAAAVLSDSARRTDSGLVRWCRAGDRFELAAERDLTEIELAMFVREARECLDKPVGEVIRRFFIANESHRAIGEALAPPPGTVASRISRGLVMGSRALEERAQPVGRGHIDA